MNSYYESADGGPPPNARAFEQVEVDPGNVVAPFAVRRVYVIYKTAEGAVRGKHAHRVLEQLAFCAVGACTFVLNDGSGPVTVRLDDPTKGVIIRGLVWREMKDFTADCVLTVLASLPYDESDYIRDFEAFIAAR